MDAGSDGLDYFFAFGIDHGTNNIYVGGGVYSTPEAFVWGDVKRPNAMRQYEPSSDISGYVGTYVSGYVVEWSDPVTTSMCFIGGKCIEEGAHEQVVTGQGRYGPTYGDHPCSVCKPSVNGNGYTPIASGCMVSTRARRPTCDAHVPVAPVAHRPYAPVPSVRSWRWTCPSSKRLATTTKGA